MTAENPNWRQQTLPETIASASCPRESDAMTTQPPSRTKFYLDKRHGKLMGVCSGIADYTGLDVTLVRIMFVSAVFMSGGSVLPLYFIAGFIADDKPRELAVEDQEEQRFWQGVRAVADPHRPRHPQPPARHRPPPGRHRKLCHDRKPQPGPRNRAAALITLSNFGEYHGS